MEGDYCRTISLVVEGPGDVAAVPLLMRRVLHHHGIFEAQIAPRPKTNVELRKLRRAGEIERYAEYCNRDEGDSILIAIDCDDFCPMEIAHEWVRRLQNLSLAKPLAICLFRCEFESMFLPSIDRIAAEYPEFRWRDLKHPTCYERVRNVKGFISDMMPKDRAYKETRDQARFANSIDLEITRKFSRSFQHFEKSVLWLTQQQKRSYGFTPVA